MKKYIFTLLAIFFCLASCTETDDISFADDGVPPFGDKQNLTEDELYSRAKVTQLQAHSAGNGMPIVIMADGFTQQQIDNGVYRSVTQKTIKALFFMEPMASLKEYFDIYEVEVPSVDGVVDEDKHNTAFSTRLVGNKSTAIRSDSVKIMKYAKKAVGEKLNQSVVITLLNSTAYAGMTLLGYDEKAQDGIASGISVALIPAFSRNKDVDVMPLLVQHEAVGHGIGKLADEYYYETEAEESEGKTCVEMQKYGMYANVQYNKDAPETQKYGVIMKDNHVLFDVYMHDIEPECAFYPLVSDIRYAGEKLKWYEGAFTYPKKFFRPTLNSIMNETLKENNDWFNLPSRLAIYKRVMRECHGNQWKCDLQNATNLNDFLAFDAPNFRPLEAKSARSSLATMPWTPSEARLSAPRIIHY